MRRGSGDRGNAVAEKHSSSRFGASHGRGQFIRGQHLRGPKRLENFTESDPLKQVIATDEAGYGPNLGPLVIASTRWKSAAEDFDPSSILSAFVFPQKRDLRSHEAKSGVPGMMVADSKAVYQTGKIELLERGVLASLYAIHNSVPKNVGQLLKWLDIDPRHLQDDDYFSCDTLPLPLVTDPQVCETLGHEWRKL